MQETTTFKSLVSLGEHLLTSVEFEKELSRISTHITVFTGAERCSVFMYEKEYDELWTIVSTGIEKIHVSSEKGIVGYVFRTKESMIENNVNKNHYFLSDVDKKSGYETHNIIACPIYNLKREIIGVLELLNKKDGFNEKDLDYLNLFANYLGSIIELAPHYIQEQ